jgi:hypothetical protein
VTIPVSRSRPVIPPPPTNADSGRQPIWGMQSGEAEFE